MPLKNIDALCNWSGCGAQCCGPDGTQRICNGFCGDCRGGCTGQGGYHRDGSPAHGFRFRRHDDGDDVDDDEAYTTRARAAFNRFDSNGDGVLSYAESMTALPGRVRLVVKSVFCFVL